MTMPFNSQPLQSHTTDFNRGIALFNRAHFFDAHEVLEDVWRALPRDHPPARRLRLHLQGVIQVAVAFHHDSTGNHVGARSVLERALRNLKGADRSFPELDLGQLRAAMANWQKHFAGSAPRPKPPQIVRRKAASSLNPSSKDR
jgi:predicted metal-dependent hydrolase